MARPLDPTIDRAITEATLTLLRERGFARMSMEAVANVAGVGKPAIYRRFRDKAELVATVIDTQLPQLELPDVGDTHAELWSGVDRGFPADAPGYVGLIGGLIAEQERHPELIEAFRRSVLLPRRATVQAAIERGQARGDIRADIPSDGGAGPAGRPPARPRLRGRGHRPAVAAAGLRHLVVPRPNPPKEHPMIDFTVETQIARPVRDVFAYATAPEHLSSWQTNTVSATRVDDGPYGLGSQLREVHRAPGGKELESVVEVVEYAPDRVFALEVKEGTPIHAHMTFDPADGGTRMRFRAHGKLSGPTR